MSRTRGRDGRGARSTARGARDGTAPMTFVRGGLLHEESIPTNAANEPLADAADVPPELWDFESAASYFYQSVDEDAEMDAARYLRGTG